MKKYLIVELGDSTYTEFLMNSGEFEETCDGIFLGVFEADSEHIAYEKLIVEFPDRKFHKLFYYELK